MGAYAREKLAVFVREFTARRLLDEMREAGKPATRSAITNWVNGHRTPRPEYAACIVELSRGRLTLSDIYGGR